MTQALNTILRGTSAVLTAALISACGGGGGDSPAPANPPAGNPPAGNGTSTPTTLLAVAAVAPTTAGAGPTTLTATHTDSGTVTWALAAGSPGSLSATTGDSVTYTPPPIGTIGAPATVSVTATLGAASKTITFTVNQAAAGIYLAAGSANGPGSLDGKGSAARVSFEGINAASMAVDAAGNTYFADGVVGTIRRMTPQGDVSTFAGVPLAGRIIDGPAASAGFSAPSSLTIDGSGNLYVIDRSLVRKITPAGVVSTVVDSGYYQLGGIAVDAAGNIYVTSSNGVHRVMPDGSLALVAGSSGSSGYADGTGAAARFRNPQGIAFDGNGNLLVADTNNRVIRQVTPAGVVTTLAGTPRQRGSTDGPGASAMFDVPVAITVDRAGRILVGDVGNHTLRVLTRSGSQVNVATLAGQAQSGLVIPGTGLDATGSAARLMLPRGLAIDLDGNTIVADGSALRKVTPAGGVTTMAGVLMNLTPADGTGSAAGFGWNLSGGTLWSDAAGNVLLAEETTNTLRKITPAGTVTTIAGSFSANGAADGPGATARFSRPRGVVGDAAGNLYVADSANYLIRKMAPDGTVSTLAGTAGGSGTADGTGATASFTNMQGMTIDAAGNLYLLDEQGNGQAVRKITPAGVVTTVKLLQNGYGYAEAIAIDGAGNLYYADYAHSVIWKLAPDGTETVLAGTVDQTGSVDGTGAAARFNSPNGLTIDPAGNLYVSEPYVGTIRKITPAGVVTTVAGVTGKFGLVGAVEPLPGHLPLGWALRYVGNNTLAVMGEGGLFKVVLP